MARSALALLQFRERGLRLDTGLQQRATWFPSAYVAGDEIAIDESLAMRSPFKSILIP